MHYKYKKGVYILIDNQNILWKGSIISLCFSYNPNNNIKGTLHKHGSPKHVQKWYDATLKKFKTASKDHNLHQKLTNAGFPTNSNNYIEMAKALIIITGKFQIEFLNKCINNTGFIGTAYTNLIKNSKKYYI